MSIKTIIYRTATHTAFLLAIAYSAQAQVPASGVTTGIQINWIWGSSHSSAPPTPVSPIRPLSSNFLMNFFEEEFLLAQGGRPAAAEPPLPLSLDRSTTITFTSDAHEFLDLQLTGTRPSQQIPKPALGARVPPGWGLTIGKDGKPVLVQIRPTSRPSTLGAFTTRGTTAVGAVGSAAAESAMMAYGLWIMAGESTAHLGIDYVLRPAVSNKNDDINFLTNPENVNNFSRPLNASTGNGVGQNLDVYNHLVEMLTGTSARPRPPRGRSAALTALQSASRLPTEYVVPALPEMNDVVNAEASHNMNAASTTRKNFAADEWGVDHRSGQLTLPLHIGDSVALIYDDANFGTRSAVGRGWALSFEQTIRLHGDTSLIWQDSFTTKNADLDNVNTDTFMSSHDPDFAWYRAGADTIIMENSADSTLSVFERHNEDFRLINTFRVGESEDGLSAQEILSVNRDARTGMVRGLYTPDEAYLFTYNESDGGLQLAQISVRKQTGDSVDWLLLSSTGETQLDALLSSTGKAYSVDYDVQGMLEKVRSDNVSEINYSRENGKVHKVSQKTADQILLYAEYFYSNNTTVMKTAIGEYAELYDQNGRPSVLQGPNAGPVWLEYVEDSNEAIPMVEEDPLNEYIDLDL